MSEKFNNADDLFNFIISRVNASLYPALLSYALEIRALIIKKIDEEKINFSGDLRKSITAEVNKEVGAYVIKVGSNMEYAPFVHEGTKPHWTPKEPIQKWVRLKLGIKGKKELKKVTFLVQRKIAKVGTKKRPFLRLVFEQEKSKAVKKITNEIIKRI